jgi:hypothetical protein
MTEMGRGGSCGFFIVIKYPVTRWQNLNAEQEEKTADLNDGEEVVMDSGGRRTSATDMRRYLGTHGRLCCTRWRERGLALGGFRTSTGGLGEVVVHPASE